MHCYPISFCSSDAIALSPLLHHPCSRPQSEHESLQRDLQVRRAHEMEILRHYHRCLIEYGSTTYSWEQCLEDYKFQFFRVLIKILVVAPGLVRERKMKRGMFAENPTPGDVKLYAMYKEMNTRLAAALVDHKWDERIDELDITAGSCLRPCC